MTGGAKKKRCRAFHVQKPRATGIYKNSYSAQLKDLVNSHSLLRRHFLEKKKKSFLASENVEVLQKLPAFAHNSPAPVTVCGICNTVPPK